MFVYFEIVLKISYCAQDRFKHTIITLLYCYKSRDNVHFDNMTVVKFEVRQEK